MNAYFASFVDVRDVAGACLAALTAAEAGGQRFIVVGDEPPTRTTDLATIAAARLPQYSLVGEPKYSDWFVWLLARVGVVSPYDEAMSTRKYAFANGRLKAVLGVHPRSLAESLQDTATSIIEGGWAKPKPKRA